MLACRSMTFWTSKEANGNKAHQFFFCQLQRLHKSEVHILPRLTNRIASSPLDIISNIIGKSSIITYKYTYLIVDPARETAEIVQLGEHWTVCFGRALEIFVVVSSPTLLVGEI